LIFLFVTPEVHRWHHSANVPDGYGYSCNYGVEFSFWDTLFGTFYLPQKNGEVVQPERIGHPGGLPDERNYLKLLLVPLGFTGRCLGSEARRELRRPSDRQWTVSSSPGATRRSAGPHAFSGVGAVWGAPRRSGAGR